MADEEMDFSKLFESLRKSASVKAGAIMFGQAQVAYYDVLKASDMSEEQAYNLLAHTTEIVVRAVVGSIPALADVALRAAAMAEMFGIRNTESDKKIPE